MEKETFVKIIDAIAEYWELTTSLNKLLGEDVCFGMTQIDKISEALEIEFEDTERWIPWWIFNSGEKKEIIIQGVHHQIPTAGDLYDLLEYNNANS